jgi:hypothetical protein
MATKDLSTAGVLSLANGDSTRWFDMQHVAAAEFQLNVTGVATVELRGANEITLDSKTDSVVLDTFTADKAGTIFEPMPRYVQFAQTAGAGSVIFSWGKAINHTGGLASIAKQGSSVGVSSELTA